MSESVRSVREKGDKKLNNYRVEMKQWTNIIKAEKEVNEYIAGCNENGVKILDITTHVTEIEDFMTYVFIFKIRS